MDQRLEEYVWEITDELNCSLEEKEDISEEMLGHLLLLKEDFLEEGCSEEEAAEKAIHTFGYEKELRDGLQSVMSPFYKPFRLLMWGAFTLYSFIVLANLLVIRMIEKIAYGETARYYFSVPENGESFWSAEVWQHNMNLTPFRNITMYLSGSEYFNPNIILHNTLGNILIFLPLGLFLPILFKKCRNWWKMLLIGTGLSLLIELTQFFTMTGQFDIDDVILNGAGTLVGYLLVKVLLKVSEVVVVREKKQRVSDV
ncbi:VanZ family protein [Jeotgalibacillus sp. R-1-5s-1]|uniref:VanZ family protein n=1 Tax=Jeotgalibacillus sp. R-1-5s-1 TaxID=2555897 RepID=UPI00106C4808|nr:VanZ family protein [Jeotgalibacillus sp. R-1-5s-1]TFE00169.1 VanZ family protein [Jeotgalibacillus sp. R-1-5s-1]